jgi:hypothetical protein
MRAGEVWAAGASPEFYLVLRGRSPRGLVRVRKLYKTRDPGRPQNLGGWLARATWRPATEAEIARLSVGDIMAKTAPAPQPPRLSAKRRLRIARMLAEAASQATADFDTGIDHRGTVSALQGVLYALGLECLHVEENSVTASQRGLARIAKEENDV